MRAKSERSVCCLVASSTGKHNTDNTHTNTDNTQTTNKWLAAKINQLALLMSKCALCLVCESTCCCCCRLLLVRELLLARAPSELIKRRLLLDCQLLLLLLCELGVTRVEFDEIV